jgi:NAD(P)-dependent dehydrogenase (short-subunit alcohol dehydrogenase family)
MDLELTGKIAVVTGASKGIGLAVVEELAAEGARVVAGARTVDALQDRENVTPFAVDLVDPDGPARLVGEAIERHGRIDVLVNNVGGVKVRLDGFVSVTDADFQASLELNFFSALRAIRASVKAMLEQGGGGTIVNVASVNAFFHPDGAVIDYGAAKAALVNVSKALSQELAPHGVRIASVSPGQVATDLWLGADGVAAAIGNATGAGAEAIRAQVTAGIPTGRFTTPREVATLVTVLASPRTANVNGSNFLIDGGLIKTL